jgi:hypothetical protein
MRQCFGEQFSGRVGPSALPFSSLPQNRSADVINVSVVSIVITGPSPSKVAAASSQRLTDGSGPSRWTRSTPGDNGAFVASVLHLFSEMAL